MDGRNENDLQVKVGLATERMKNDRHCRFEFSFDSWSNQSESIMYVYARIYVRV